MQVRSPGRDEVAAHRGPRMRFLGVLGAASFLAVSVFAVVRSHAAWPTPENPVKDLDGGAAAIGDALFNRWVLSFEVTSFLLLGAILGAVILTKRRLT